MQTLAQELRQKIEATDRVRREAKSGSGHLTPFGRDLIATGAKHGVPQHMFVQLLDVSAATVSRKYADQVPATGAPDVPPPV